MSIDGFDDFLADVREGAAVRERERHLLYPQLQRLRALGFGAVRVPREHGGAGITLRELFSHLIRLSAADASLGHVWRGHVAFVETLRANPAEAERWWPRLVAGELVGNAQSERNDTARLETEVARASDGTVTVSGKKFYTTGSLYADWIHLAALDGDDRVSLTVDARQDGVQSVDDWDGFGQTLTGSGTTVFDAAHVHADDIAASGDNPARWHHLGAVFQLSLLAVVAGIAQRAHDDAVAYVLPRRRTFGFAGVTLPREDPLVQLVIGDLAVAARTARRLVLSVAEDLDALAGPTATDAEREDLHLEVFAIQDQVLADVLEATTRLFEVGGASAVGRELGLDRHWRNVRTIASHNPVMQRTRALGLHSLTGSLPAWKAPGR